MDSKPFVFVDIETNGGSGARGRVIEVAAIRVENGDIVDTFRSLINPGTTIPSWITNLTGISGADAVDAPFFIDIAHDLYRFMDGCVFVAHNVLFDYSFLKREFALSGYAFTPKLFCTVKMSRAFYPEHHGHSLQKIIERHNLSPAARHRAYDDALMIYTYVTLAIAQKGIEAFRANLALQLKIKSLPPNVDESVILSLPEQAGVYIFEDDEGRPLYVGKSVNIRTRVKSHFTSATSIAKEMRMSLQSHNISYIKTETEIEALLLESAKVKELQPVYNRLLRRKTAQSILVRHTDEQGYKTFHIESHDLSTYADLDAVYGVFTTKRHAKTLMESLARTYQLCPKLLGLEKTSGFCFRYQLGLCRGACGEIEKPESYNPRVEFALERSKIETWPFASKVAVRISQARSMIINQWVPEGIYDHEQETFSALPNRFDIDTYKIIRAFIRTHRAAVTPFTGVLE